MQTRSGFMAHVEQDSESGCWEWTGWRDSRGYGKGTSDQRPRAKDWAHRIAFRLFVGAIPDGLTIDHLCRNRGCVNPEHLDAITLRENIRRGEKANRTHCIHGHTLADAYIDRSGGYERRKCRACHLARVRARRQ